MRLKLKGKIQLITISLLILLSTSILGIVYFQVHDVIIKNLNTSLDAYIKLSNNLLEQKYTGNWRVEGDKLYKGDKLINSDTEFVDTIKSATNSPATIFLNDTRVSTNVFNNGERALGTKASQAVADIVLKQGREYSGEANVVGIVYQAKYIPLKDNTGKAIGILFIGIEKGRITAQINALMITIGIITLIVLTLAIFASAMFTNPIIKNIKKILGALKNISQGDLTSSCNVVSSDETMDISKELNNMQNNVSELVAQIKDSSSTLKKNSDALTSISYEMSNASEEVANAIQEVASGASSQSNDLIEISGIINNFGNEIEAIVESIKTIDSSSREITVLADDSNRDMKYLVESIENTNSTFSSFMAKLLQLGQNIGKINEITSLINSVAEQTNLLALNAAIEAARAGEAGKGFSVVAEEIRKLAEQSKNSSQDINSLIAGIFRDNAAIVQSSEGMSSEIRNQINVVNAAIGSFKKIIHSLSEVTPLIASVNNSAGNISKEKEGIIDKIEALSSVSQEVSASSEEISASSEQMSASAQEVTATAQTLNSMTDAMMAQVNRFKLAY